LVAQRNEWRLISMCRFLKLHRSGFYAWLHEPLLPMAKVSAGLTARVKQFYDKSMAIYGSPASSMTSNQA
jgi:putative transposase